MSGAFSRENDDAEAFEDLGEHPVSPHRNLVTPEGLAQIERELEAARSAFAKAEHHRQRYEIAVALRDLNYWSARRANAELVQPILDKEQVRFGHTVSVRSKVGKTQSFKIVGEDEADPARGLIPYVAPLAKALIGKSVGDYVEVVREKAEIVAIA